MRKRRGFTLLEVLMAVALFGAVVTTILSAQAGLVAGNKSAANMSQAIEIGRCRMSEVEEKQLKLGYPEIEEKDSSQFCCDEKEVPGFTCAWQVERVLLPQATSLASDAGLSSVLGGGLGLDAGNIGSIATGMGTSLASPIGSMMSNPLGGASLDLDGGLQNMGQVLGQSFGGQGGMGVQGLMSLVFSLVYPSLKPLLELAIRRVTVTVKWKEGKSDREFRLMQYITNPSQAGLLAGLADAGVGAGDGGMTTAPNKGGATTASPVGAPLGASALMMPRRSLAGSRGMTLIEVMVAIAVLAMVAVLIHGVIDSLSRGRKGEGMRAERAHQGREAMLRIVRDLSGAYLSLHVPAVPALMTERTAFVGRSSAPFDRMDFTSFAHLRTERDSHESDQAEVGYFVVKDPDVPDKMDLVRREQTPIDYEPLKGGIVNVVAEDVEKFDVRFFDPQTSQWVETWDTMQTTGQPNRLPLEVDITIVLKGVGEGAHYSYTTKTFLPIQTPLSFGITQ